MEPLEAAGMLKALGDPTRLRIFMFLKSCCCPVAVGDEGEVRPIEGPTVGEICCNVFGADRISSTTSFHLKELRQSGLITMERRGKNMVCGINRPVLARLTAFLSDTITDPTPCCD